MRVRLLFFASLAEKAGVAEEEREVVEGTTPGAIWERLVLERPALAAAARPAVAVNREYAAADRPLRDGDELAFLPPVSGG